MKLNLVILSILTASSVIASDFNNQDNEKGNYIENDEWNNKLNDKLYIMARILDKVERPDKSKILICDETLIQDLMDLFDYELYDTTKNAMKNKQNGDIEDILYSMRAACSGVDGVFNNFYANYERVIEYINTEVTALNSDNNKNSCILCIKNMVYCYCCAVRILAEEVLPKTYKICNEINKYNDVFKKYNHIKVIDLLSTLINVNDLPKKFLPKLTDLIIHQYQITHKYQDLDKITADKTSKDQLKKKIIRDLEREIADPNVKEFVLGIARDDNIMDQIIDRTYKEIIESQL